VAELRKKNVIFWQTFVKELRIIPGMQETTTETLADGA
jgi:hypothetical protein